MNILKNLSIKSKLILASFLSLMGLLFYLQMSVRQDLRNKESAERVIADVSSIQEISKVLHEFQRERALALAYVEGNGTTDSRAFLTQHEQTDKAIAGLMKVQREQRRSFITNIFDSLTVNRAKISPGRPIGLIDPFYRNIKSELLNEVSNIIRGTGNLGLKNHFEEHLLLLTSKDFLASLRSEVGSAIAAGEFRGARYGSFASTKGIHEFNFARLQKIASPELKQYLDKKYQGPFVDQTYQMIESIFKNPKLESIDFNFEKWWSVSSASINSLKEIEDYSGEVINNRANEVLYASTAGMSKNLTIAVLVIATIVTFVVFTIRDILGAIQFIRVSADKMALGDVSTEVDLKRRDEIGQLATSFRKMIVATRDFTTVAERIGKGDYAAPVEIRSNADALGVALDKMKTDLQKLSLESQTRTWLLAGNSDLNDTLRGEKDVKTLAQDVITQLAKQLKAQIGGIYLKENDKLILVGSYAFQERKRNANVFKIGHGLIGQAALEQKPIVFSEIPNDYIRINSGLGNAIPKNIIVFPFSYENEIKGVVELGFTHEVSELDIQFLELAGNNIAIAITASQSREKLKDLLEETQRQAEELEVQQEELKQANEELQEKTALLEKSESELKTQQEELQQTNEELEEKAQLLEEQKERLEITKLELENKARELEATSKYKSEFLANMSHELRTPLNSILILSQLLSENKHNVLGEKEVEFVKNIHSSGTDLLNLINEILDLSKVESGKMELEIGEVTFEELAGDMKSMFSEIAKVKSIEFNINIDTQRLRQTTMLSDVQRVKQILRNLLSNAFKFTERNGQVSLMIGRPAGNAIFTSKKLMLNAEVVAFSVTDTGIGIPANKQGIIFEAFQQAEGSTKRKYGGTGLGLSISRELAHALGGEIHLSSIEGQGSIFTLYLPLQFESSGNLPPKELTEIVKTEVERPAILHVDDLTENKNIASDDRYNIGEDDKVVLIIEDDPTFSKLLLDFVRDRKYKGIVANQGNTGLSYARHYKPDAILLDMKLPVMDGMDVLKHLKMDPQLRHVPVEIISGYDVRKEAIELGAFDFVKKPADAESLQNAFNKIENFINRKLKRLLIVEDNELQNKAIRELIGNGDVKCFSVYSGKEAIEALKKEKFDCMIVDLGLPDMVGFELLQKIKNDAVLSRIPIVVYTGKDLTKEETSTLNRLASTVILKTAHSFERLLDETTLFLHRVESKLPNEKQTIIRKLHKTDEVLRNKTVLVVDDDIRNTYSLTNALIEEGLNCLVAENGKAAIQMLKENNAIDIVLMDIMMPEMDGYEATKEIRKISKFEKLPIIALTAKAMKGDRDKSLAAGMSDYVPKPVNVPQLLSLMRVWLYR